MSTSRPNPTLRRLKRTDLFKAGMCATWEVQGITAECEGRIVAVVGVQRFDKHLWVFCNVFEPVRPVFLHRLVVNLLRAHARINVGPVLSLADATPGAERWHRVLGFRPLRDAERDEEIRLCETSNAMLAWIKGGQQ